MKALIAVTVAFPVVFLLFVVIPVMGGEEEPPPCTPGGGSPLELAGGSQAPWGRFNAEQMTNAALIVRIGAERNIPPRGQQIALMTAINESTLIPKKQHGMSEDNPETAWGLFQQTPKYGWGTREQVMDPVYATNKFYERLVQVEGWEQMPPTLASHAVQGNADPYAAAKYWTEAGELLAHLTGGGSPAAGSDVAPVADQPSTDGERVPVNVSTANIPSRAGAGFGAALRRVLASSPGLVALQEQSQRSARALRAAAPGYEVYKDPAARGQAASTAVMWRASDWSLTDSGRVQIVASGPQRWDGGRSATWVTVQNAAGQLVSLISVHHMINPAKYGPNKPLRQRLYGQGMDVVVDLAERLGERSAVFVAGDFNTHTSQQGEPWSAAAKMKAAGFGWVDHGVDIIFYPQNGAALTGSANGALGVSSDDHPWVSASFSAQTEGGTVGGPTYCDDATGGGTDAGGSGFQVNAAADYVGPYPPDVLRARAENPSGAEPPLIPRGNDGSWYGDCQNFVAQLAGRPTSGYYSAGDAWALFVASGVAHPANGVDGYAPPPGAWLYYDSGRPYGHVVTYLGNGMVAGTDTWGTGEIGIGKATDLTGGIWNQTYLGWVVPWPTAENDIPVKPPRAGTDAGSEVANTGHNGAAPAGPRPAGAPYAREQLGGAREQLAGGGVRNG